MKWSMMLCASIGLISAAHAAEDIAPGLICPNTINTVQQAASVPIEFQSVVRNDSHALQDIAFSDGPPGDKGTMVPSETEGENGGVGVIKTWRFRWSSDRPVHVTCHYEGTTVTLVRALDPKVKKCVVTYNGEILVGGYQKIISSSCR